MLCTKVTVGVRHGPAVMESWMLVVSFRGTMSRRGRMEQKLRREEALGNGSFCHCESWRKIGLAVQT